jgi:hypothetical protein
MNHQYVILGHSSISNNPVLEKVPPGVKLIFQVKCGQSLSSNRVLRPVFRKINTAIKYARGNNVVNNIKNYYNENGFTSLNKNFQLTTRGLERFVFNGNKGDMYPSQVVSLAPFVAKEGYAPLHSGVYKVPINILSNNNISNKSIVRVNQKIRIPLKELLDIVKPKTPGTQVVVYAQFCRALKNFNKENKANNTGKRVYEITGSNRKVYRMRKNEIKAIPLRKRITKTPHKLGLNRGRQGNIYREYMKYKILRKKLPRGMSVGRRPKTAL